MDEAIVIEAHRLLMANARLCAEISKHFRDMHNLGVSPYYNLPGYGSRWFAEDFLARSIEMEEAADRWLNNNLR